MYFLFDSFKRSVSIFQPENFKRYILVTLNATLKSYKVIIGQLWWLFVILFGAEYFGLQEVLYSFIWPIIFIFIIVLASRASVNKKNLRYFYLYLKHFIYFIIAALILRFLLVQIEYYAGSFLFLLFLQTNRFVLHTSPFYIFAALFFLDSKAESGSAITSFFKAVKLIIFNYPFLFISYYLFYAIHYVLYFLSLHAYQIIILNLFGHLSDVSNIILIILFVIVELLLFIFIISYFVTFYIKTIHDNFQFYFDTRRVTLFNVIHTLISRFLLLVLMIIYLIPTIIFLVLPKKWGAQTKLFYWLEYIFSWLVLKISFLPIKIEGWKNLPTEPSIIVANHQSSFDIPTLVYILQRSPHVWLAIKTLMESPILRFILPRLAVLVDASSPMKAMRSLIEIQRVVKGQQTHIIVFPEGGRYTDGSIHDFFGGYVILAKKMQRPVVPVYIHGLNKVYPPDTFWVHYAKVHVVIGEQMIIESHETEEQFNQRVYNWFKSQPQQKI